VWREDILSGLMGEKKSKGGWWLGKKDLGGFEVEGVLGGNSRNCDVGLDQK